MHLCMLDFQQRQMQADCPQTVSLPAWQAFRRQRPDDRLYDSSIPTSAVHTVSPPRWARKHGENLDLWMVVVA